MAEWATPLLRRTLSSRFSLDEARDLAFDIGLDPEEFNKDTLIRRLIGYTMDRRKPEVILEWIRRHRPDIDADPLEVEVLGALARAAGGAVGTAGTVVRDDTPPPTPAGAGTVGRGGTRVGRRWEYLDFDVAIDAYRDDEFRVRVFDSPAGQTDGYTTIRLADEPEIRSGLDALRSLRPDARAVERMGVRLHKLLFKDDPSDLYYQTRGRADGAGKGVRIRLRLGTPGLKRLPWEYLFDTKQQSFLALSPGVVVSRYLDVPQGLSTLPRPATLRVLLILSNPDGSIPLDLKDEQRRIEAATQGLRDAGRLAMDVLVNPTTREIRRALRQAIYHAVHYSGHADFRTTEEETGGAGGTVRNVTIPTPGGVAAEADGVGMVVLADDNGGARELDEGAFALFFKDYPDIRLIILNACKGGTVSTERRLSGLGERLMLSTGTPAVIAMQFEIEDEAARDFAGEFYAALADGWPADAAVAQARLALYQDHGAGDRAWGTPVLFMRAEDGELFG